MRGIKRSTTIVGVPDSVHVMARRDWATAPLYNFQPAWPECNWSGGPL